MGTRLYKETFTLFEIFQSIIRNLTPEQVLYWSRNDDELAKILQFATDPRKVYGIIPTRAPMDFLAIPLMRPTNLFASNRYSLELAGNLFALAAKLKPEELTHWIEKPGTLLERLEEHYLSPLGDQADSANIEAQTGLHLTEPEVKVVELKRPMGQHLEMSEENALPVKSPKSEEVVAYSYPVNCLLYLHEAIELVDKENGFMESCLTFQQIMALCSKQCKYKKPGFLSFEHSTYFPIKNRKKKIGLLQLHWKTDVERNGWRVNFMDRMFQHSRLVIL